MTPERIGGVEIDRCGTCNARWLDPGELGPIVRAVNANVLTSWGTPSSGGDTARWPGCPRDGHDLAGYQWLGAELGRCRLCRGVLLDAGSWAALTGAAEKKEGMPRAELGLSAAEMVIHALFLIDR